MVLVCPGDTKPVSQEFCGVLAEETPLLPVFSGFFGFFSFSRPDFMMHRIDDVGVMHGPVFGFPG